MFSKVLIANRGEIAVRVIRACRELSVRAVCVYSDADAGALHVREADEAYRIGEAPARQSYLAGERVIEAALRAGAEAIHPGYGFLSENPGFARAVRDAGLVFVGPPAEAMERMGAKTTARACMQEAGVPVVPGTPAGDDEALLAAAEEVGFPLLVKASAGGGGKGMRRVDSKEALPAAIAAARTEARQSFGSDEVYLERLLVRPRHVEVQVLGEADGRVLHLFERECSVQRRHQKVVEESPCAVLTAEERERATTIAVKAAEAVGYVGAGTVELLRGDDGSFFFLEMNTRLQVEHPVTELVTGTDLVKAQLRIAAGEPSGIDPARLALRGHAIEARVYAEDAERGFAPSAGRVHVAEAPLGPHVRVDAGIATGDEVPVHYDPMLSKVIAWGETREEAIRTLREALRRYTLLGPVTNLPFLLAILEHPTYVAGDVHVAWLDEALQGWRSGSGAPTDDALVAAALMDHLGLGTGGAGTGGGAGEGGAGAGDRFSPWRGGCALPGGVL